MHLYLLYTPLSPTHPRSQMSLQGVSMSKSNVSWNTEWNYVSLVVRIPVLEGSVLSRSMNGQEGRGKVSKGAKIRNRYNRVPHLSQDTKFHLMIHVLLWRSYQGNIIHNFRCFMYKKENTTIHQNTIHIRRWFCHSKIASTGIQS